MKNLKNKSQILLFLGIIPVAVVVGMAVLTVIGPIFQQIGQILTNIAKIAFPNWKTGTFLIISIIYFFALGFMTAMNMISKVEKERYYYEEGETEESEDIDYTTFKVS